MRSDQAKTSFAGHVAFQILGATLIVMSLIPAGPATAEFSDRDRAICSALDVHITTMIEDAATTGEVAAIELHNAFLQQLQARAHCGAGRYQEAYAIYLAIDLSGFDNNVCATREGG